MQNPKDQVFNIGMNFLIEMFVKSASLAAEEQSLHWNLKARMKSQTRIENSSDNGLIRAWGIVSLFKRCRENECFDLWALWDVFLRRSLLKEGCRQKRMCLRTARTASKKPWPFQEGFGAIPCTCMRMVPPVLSSVLCQFIESRVWVLFCSTFLSAKKSCVFVLCDLVKTD